MLEAINTNHVRPVKAVRRVSVGRERVKTLYSQDNANPQKQLQLTKMSRSPAMVHKRENGSGR